MTMSAPTPTRSATFVRCNLCGADDAETVFEAGVAQINRIVKCRRCGLMYSNPRLRPADQEVVKSHNPQLVRHAEAYDPGRYDKERRQVRDYRDTLRSLASLYPRRGRLIELGCGMGFLLKALAHDGWDAVGVEPDRGFCQFIEDEHGMTAIPAVLEEAGIPDGSVDVVVFLHVIEHVPDPLSTLQRIHGVLKPGGHLVIETPRYDSLMFRLLGHRERSVSCDGHIYFFTSETLRKLYEKAGFRHCQLRYVGRSLSLGRLAWNLGVMSKSAAVQKVLGKISSSLRLEKAHVRLNARDMQRVLVQKPAELR